MEATPEDILRALDGDKPVIQEIPVPGVKRLSPTMLNWFEKDREKFILYYVLGARRDKQNKAMAMGSAFDARVKGELEHDLLGIPNRWETLFNSQVDSTLHIYCRDRSLEVLEAYKKTGAYAALLKIIDKFHGTPQFEFDSAGIVTVNGLDIPVYGKPDGFVELEYVLFILDWKLNGYMTQCSPAKGYVHLRSEDGFDSGSHKDVLAEHVHGIKLTRGNYMREDWQTQVCMYQKMVHPNHEKQGVVCIEQLAYSNGTLRVATHRTIISAAFSEQVNQRMYKAWNAIVTQHYYPEVSKDESDAKVRELMNMDELDRWALSM